MTTLSHLDEYDTKILQSLQSDGRLSNAEIADRVSLSPSQCSRRRQNLEAQNIITGYHASISREKTGFSLINFISVTLATHNKNNATQFSKLVNSLPEVLEAHALTGEMDYILKVVTQNLADLATLVNDKLLPHESVMNVKTAVVLNTIKETAALPLSTTR